MTNIVIARRINTNPPMFGWEALRVSAVIFDRSETPRFAASLELTPFEINEKTLKIRINNMKKERLQIDIFLKTFQSTFIFFIMFFILVFEILTRFFAGRLHFNLCLPP